MAYNNFNDFIAKRPNDKRIKIYFLSFLIGIAASILFLGGFKLIYFIIKISVNHWMWALGLLIALFILKKIFKKKKKK